jgi:hypothetical protein
MSRRTNAQIAIGEEPAPEGAQSYGSIGEELEPDWTQSYGSIGEELEPEGTQVFSSYSLGIDDREPVGIDDREPEGTQTSHAEQEGEQKLDAFILMTMEFQCDEITKMKKQLWDMLYVSGTWKYEQNEYTKGVDEGLESFRTSAAHLVKVIDKYMRAGPTELVHHYEAISSDYTAIKGAYVELQDLIHCLQKPKKKQRLQISDPPSADLSQRVVSAVNERARILTETVFPPTIGDR